MGSDEGDQPGGYWGDVPHIAGREGWAPRMHGGSPQEPFSITVTPSAALEDLGGPPTLRPRRVVNRAPAEGQRTPTPDLEDADVRDGPLMTCNRVPRRVSVRGGGWCCCWWSRVVVQCVFVGT
jgi:hypothetical protein